MKIIGCLILVVAALAAGCASNRGAADDEYGVEMSPTTRIDPASSHIVSDPLDPRL